MKLNPGTLFANDYEVVRELSTGGMGTVYVVLQRSTGKQRALKLMLPHFVADAALRKRFEQEARVASLIDSDHVVEVVGAGVDETSGSPWLAMELLKGEELSAQAVLTSPDPVGTALTILRQVCHALGAAHAAGIVHRDLKPENVFLADSKRAGETRTVKVLDFGIAKIAAEAKSQHTAALGSPIWMAPEQSAKGAVTPAADVWSLGLVAYHLLTGKYFWHAAQSDEGTIHQVMREVLFDPIPPASHRAAEQGAPPLPPWFDPWFARCVAREPTHRFPDASAAFAALGGASYVPTPSPSLVLPPLQSMPRQSIPASAGVRSSATQMGSGMTQPAISQVESPRSRAPRIAASFVALVAVCGISFVAWERRNARSHVVPPVVLDVPSATADIPVDNEPVGPAPTLDSGLPSKKKKTVHGTDGGTLPSLSSAIAAEVGTTKPPTSTEGEFDRAGATIQLARLGVQRCATPDGPKGPSNAKIYFGDDGHPRNIIVDAHGPYAGTPVEDCLKGMIHRQVHVAPFVGLMQMVNYDFNLR